MKDYSKRSKEQLIDEIETLSKQLAESAKLGIKERQREAKYLMESEKKYRMLTENIPLYITYKNMKFQYMYCNKRTAREWNIDQNDIVGKTDYDLFDKSVAAKYRKEDERIIKTGRQLEFEELNINKGKEKYIYVTKAPIKDDNGKIIGILGIFRDNTNIKRLEYDLKLFEALINQSNDSIFVIKPSTGDILYVNDKTCMSLKYTYSEMLDMNISDIDEKIGNIREWKIISGQIKEKVRTVLMTDFLKSDGTIYPVEVNVAYVKYGTKDYFIAIARDINECKELLGKVKNKSITWPRG